MRALKQERKTSVAVILNANAKRVTPRVQERLERECEGIDIYYSRSLEEARRIAREVVEHGYETVLTGGGDGTIIQTINSLYQLTGRLEQSSATPRGLRLIHSPRSPMPQVGVLKLGTGNALATVVGASAYHRDAERVRMRTSEGAALPVMELPLMQAEGEVFPFAGLGWDAAVLNDYNWLKESVTWGPAHKICKSVAGYLIAALGITGPGMIGKSVPQVEVKALGPAAKLNGAGQVEKRFSVGETLYAGPLHLGAFSTIPYYGYKFKLFPFAEGMGNRCQLRLSSMPLSEVVLHLAGVWRGTYRSPGLHDFYAEGFEIQFDRPMPYHVGGDARGMREKIEVQMNPHPVTMLDYRTSLEPVRNPVLALVPGLLRS